MHFNMSHFKNSKLCQDLFEPLSMTLLDTLYFVFDFMFQFVKSSFQQVMKEATLFGKGAKLLVNETRIVILSKYNKRPLMYKYNNKNSNYYNFHLNKNQILEYTNRYEHHLIAYNKEALLKFLAIFIIQIPPIIGVMFVYVIMKYPKFCLPKHFWNDRHLSDFNMDEYHRRNMYISTKMNISFNAIYEAIYHTNYQNKALLRTLCGCLDVIPFPDLFGRIKHDNALCNLKNSLFNAIGVIIPAIYYRSRLEHVVSRIVVDDIYLLMSSDSDCFSTPLEAIIDRNIKSLSFEELREYLVIRCINNEEYSDKVLQDVENSKDSKKYSSNTEVDFNQVMSANRMYLKKYLLSTYNTLQHLSLSDTDEDYVPLNVHEKEHHLLHIGYILSTCRKGLLSSSDASVINQYNTIMATCVEHMIRVARNQ